MAIHDTARADLDEIRAFADGIATIYHQAAALQRRINRYVAGVTAIATDTADERERTFVQMVQTFVSQEDLARVGTLLPTIGGLIATIETDYQDFL